VERSSDDVVRRLAESLYRRSAWGGGDADLTAHVQRVVSMVPRDAQAVAWLHEAFEYAHWTAEDLAVLGFEADEIHAIRLLTRDGRPASDVDFLQHLAAVARAPGNAGRLARIIALADLNDRIQHPPLDANDWHPPYAAGVAVLERDASI
jgi:hypothetical protein